LGLGALHKVSDGRNLLESVEPFLDRFNPELVVGGSRHLDLTQLSQFLDFASVDDASDTGLFLGQLFGFKLGGGLSGDLFIQLSLDCCLFIGLLSFEVLLQLVLCLFFSFGLCQISLNSRIVVVASLSELDQTNALFFLVNFTFLFVFVFHPATFVAVLCLLRVMLVELSKFPPGIEVLPILIESLDKRGGRVLVTDEGGRFLKGPHFVSFEDLIEHYVKFFISLPVTFFGDFIVEWECRVVESALLFISEGVVGLLDHQPHFVLPFGNVTSKFVGVVLQGLLLVLLADLFYSCLPGLGLKGENTVKVSVITESSLDDLSFLASLLLSRGIDRIDAWSFFGLLVTCVIFKVGKLGRRAILHILFQSVEAILESFVSFTHLLNRLGHGSQGELSNNLRFGEGWISW
jgi:hypothetical protein